MARTLVGDARAAASTMCPAAGCVLSFPPVRNGDGLPLRRGRGSPPGPRARAPGGGRADAAARSGRRAASPAHGRDGEPAPRPAPGHQHVGARSTRSTPNSVAAATTAAARRYTDHRTPHPHECDARCRPHQCRPRRVHDPADPLHPQRCAEARRALGLGVGEPDHPGRAAAAGAEGEAAAAEP
jgi:hypothetical protein